MRPVLKDVSQQVIVITGASSGIGLVTARMAAKRGAKLVLSSRNEDALKQLTEELSRRGTEAVYVVADVGDEAQVQRIADTAIQRFGGFDTWVNNAGVSIFGRSEHVPLKDQRKLFDTNFWGVVHGSLMAIAHLKQHGGALINIGSEVSDVALPLQGAYSASKHAVKGYTDALRLELEQARAPVSVTLIQPASVDTLFVEHSRNYMSVQPKLPPPAYAPELVAQAILYAAAHPKRHIYVGGVARMAVSASRLAPRLTDWMLKNLAYRAQRSKEPARLHEEDALYGPGRALQERQGMPGPVFERSLYTQAVMHPRAAVIGLAVVVGLAWLLLAPRRSSLGYAQRITSGVDG